MTSTAQASPNRSWKKKFLARSGAVARWLHLYVSMFGFLSMFFFAWTGITLNHPLWFGGEEGKARSEHGVMPLEWLASEYGGTFEDRVKNAEKVDKLKIAEYLRSAHHLRGAVADFRVEDDECSVSFKSPGYSADILINRELGEYEITVLEHGLVARWNDLHKGRDSGLEWSVLIDLSALIMIVSSVTGVLMLMFMRKKRKSGIIAGVVGALVFVFFCWYAMK